MASERALGQGLAFALVVSISALGHAAPTASDRESARHLFDEGRGYMRSNEPLRAIEAFEKAHEIVHVPTTGLALARAHVAAGHLIEARDIALETSRLPHDSSEPAVLDEARRQARDLEAQLRSRVPMLRVRGKGATTLAVDGKEVGAEPVPVNPGKHVVSAKNAEGVENRLDVEIAEREVKDVEISFSRPDRVVKRPVPVLAPPERTSTARVLLFGGLGLAVVGTAVGLTTGALTLSRAGDLDAQCESDICAPSARDDLDAAQTLGTISTIGFVAAAVGVGALVLGVALPRTTPRTGARPMVLSF
jgi:hypothetical protein